MDFSDQQRLLLATICEYFHTRGDWPTYGLLDRQLMNHEDLDVEVVVPSLESFMYDGAYRPMTNWEPERLASLSISALHRCLTEGICTDLSDDLDAFMQAVRLGIEKHIDGDNPAVITAAELRERYSMSDLMLRKVLRLLQSSSLFGGSGSNENDPSGATLSFNVTVAPIVRRYRKAATLDDYFAVRQKALVPMLAPSAGPTARSTVDGLPLAAPEWPHPAAPAIALPAAQHRLTPLVQGRNPNRGSATPAKARCEGDFEYDVAVSFAGPQRHLAERLATLVKEAGFSVFYDNFYPDHLWGKDLPTFFDQVYREKSRYCVPFFSNEYIERMWTSWERRSATTRLLQERGNEYLLPIMVERVEVPGIPTTIGHLALDQYSIDEIAAILIKKLTAGHAPAKGAGKQVSFEASGGLEVGLAGSSRLSRNAQQVLEYLALNHDPDDFVTYQTIEHALDLHDEPLDDALHDLRDKHVIKVHAEGGELFSLIQPQVRAWQSVSKSVLGYDVHEDMLKVARAVEQQSPIEGVALSQVTGLPAKRINVAALLLKSERRIDLVDKFHAAPFLFAQAEANYRTRQWLGAAESRDP